MADYRAVNVQPQCIETIEKIIEKRFDENGIKDSKTRIVSEAVKKLADEELGK